MASPKQPPLAVPWRPGLISHTEFASTDAQASKKFFERVFDWKFGPSGTDDYLIFRTPHGASGGGLRPTEPEEAPGATVYVEVEDLEAAQKRVEKAGGRLVLPRVDLGEKGSFFWCQIPGGIVVACFESPAWARGKK